ncbi:MAG: methyltransferase domain-containing protein [Solirubrobacteraceae bacterium]|nr:methyltransferase domain-containing protein [Solirubrobacteraceae bacterium]
MRAEVSDRGIVLGEALDEPVDILFGDDRVWSFNPARDGARQGRELIVGWPGSLAERLDGVTPVRLVVHNSGEELWRADEVRFGSTDRALRLRDKDGNPLAVDKTGRLQRTFTTTDSDSRRHLVEATARVLDDLRDVCGLDAYLAYGCLLGARRTGAMIGHDSDTDVAFLSKHTHPFDIIRECRAAELTMRERGWSVARMSSANFKVWVPLPNGARAGVDVFGSFHVGDHFHIMGSLRGRLPREAIVPFGTITLEGVEMPAPRDVDAFLAYTYGPGWKVPDPAFHFEHPPENTTIMSGWWRGARRGLKGWQTFYGGSQGRKVPNRPSLFAGWAEERMAADRAAREAAGTVSDGPDTVVDLGCGNGRDSVFLAGQGYDVRAFDYSSKGRALARRLARRRGVTVRLTELSVASPRDVLLRGAQLAHEPGVRHVYARGLLDNLEPSAREDLWRFCAMVQRRGGLTFLEFRTPRSRQEPKHFGPRKRQYPAPARVRAEIERRGGTVVEVLKGRDLAPLGKENPYICRMIVRWH